MNSHRLRPLIAWTLYACVLFNLLSCGIAHGQMSGLMLNGAGGAFCSLIADAPSMSKNALTGAPDLLKSSQFAARRAAGR